MRRLGLVLLVLGVASVVCLEGIVQSAQKKAKDKKTLARIAAGKKLFASPRLGRNGKTCKQCHEWDIGAIAPDDDDELKDAINNCLKMRLDAARPLASDSKPMEALVSFIRAKAGAKSKKAGAGKKKTGK